jgi:MFS family permease
VRKVTAAIGLQIAAIGLAFLQALGGVRTDEAKYLLNIPYPHPPLVRFVLGLTSSIPHQEMLWRIVFATLLIQSIWIVWWMSKGMTARNRGLLMLGWILSAAVVLQAGSIMMAPLTALEGLVLIALLFLQERDPECFSLSSFFWIGVFWLCSLLTAYQAILYVPVMAALAIRSPLPKVQRWIIVLGPVFVAFLFVLWEPMIAASFINAGTKDGSSLPHRLISVFQTWSLGGSFIVSIPGMAGMLLLGRKSLPILLSFVLVAAFLFISFRQYYAVLFTPLFIGGTALLLERTKRNLLPVLPLLVASFALCVFLNMPSLVPTPARETIRSLRLSSAQTGTLLISGAFGHEWEYESPLPVLRFHPLLLPDARAVVCLSACTQMQQAKGFRKLPAVSPEAWVRTM